MTSTRVARLATLGALAVLVVTAAVLRRTALSPPALWADDAWVALISRHAWGDIWFTSLTSVGFRAMIGAAIAPFGESTVAAQALPFAFGLAAIPATYTVARRLDLRRPPALFAAVLVATSPLLATYSTRVKQYSGDALFTLAITASALWVLRAPSARARWWTLAATSCAAIAFSGQLALVVGPAVAVAAAGSRRRWRDVARTAVPAILVVVAFAAFWYSFVLRPTFRPVLAAYWADHYIVLWRGAARALDSLSRGLGGLLAGTIGPSTANKAAALLLLGVAVARRPAVTAALLLPLLAAITAAGAELAPIGARTDAYLAPLIALAMAVGLDALISAGPRDWGARVPSTVRYGVAGLCAAALLVGLPARATPRPYPPQDLRTLTRTWEAQRQPGDHTFVLQNAVHAFVLYSREPVVTRLNGKRLAIATIDSPAISLLRRRPRAKPWVYYPRVVRAAVSDGTRRVWVVAAHRRHGEAPALEEAVTALGFAPRERWRTAGEAEMTLYERPPAR